jgi:hypothetical protein
MSGDFGITNNGGVVLNSTASTHHVDSYERSLYDEFTMKQQQQVSNQRNVPIPIDIIGAPPGNIPTPNFLSGSVRPNEYIHSGNMGFRSFPAHSSSAPPQSQNPNQHHSHTTGFVASQNHPNQNISNRQTYPGKIIAQSALNGSSSSSNSDLSEEVGSLAALDGLTDLLPMMPTSEAVKLSLRHMDRPEEDTHEEKLEIKSLTNNNSLLLIGSSPTSPTPSINGSTIQMKNWDESGSVASSSSHTSAFSSGETPPPLTPTTSLYHLQPLKPSYQMLDNGGKLAGTTMAHNFHTGPPSHQSNASHLEFACSAPEVTSLLLSDFGVSVSNSDAEWLDNLIKL